MSADEPLARAKRDDGAVTPAKQQLNSIMKSLTEKYIISMNTVRIGGGVCATMANDACKIHHICCLFGPRTKWADRNDRTKHRFFTLKCAYL